MVKTATTQAKINGEAHPKLSGEASPKLNGEASLSPLDVFRQHRANPIFCLMIFAVSLIASVLTLEFLLTLAGVGEEEYLKRDQTMGWVPMPGKHITWRKEGYSVSKVNSSGMLEREIALQKPADTLRIAVIGSSDVESLQVPRDATFCRLVEDALNKKFGSTNQKVTVLNFGTSAYNIGQIYLRLKNLVKDFQPDIVVIGSTVDATKMLALKREGFFSARPEFSLNENKELVCNYDRQNAWTKSAAGRRAESIAWLREHSHIWGVVSIAAEQWTNWKEGLQNGYSSWGAELTSKNPAFNSATDTGNAYGVFTEVSKKVFTELPHPLTAADQAVLDSWWPLHAALLKEMKNECDKLNAEMVILRLPSLKGHDNLSERELVKKFANTSGVLFIDPTETFIKNMLNFNTPLFYNPHMAPKGHELLAEQVTAALTPVVAAKKVKP